MFSKQHVEIAHKFYSAQKAMQFIHGDQYAERVAETQTVIERVAAAHKCDVLPATKICIEKIVERFPFGNGFMVAMLLATAVEMCEGAPNKRIHKDAQKDAPLWCAAVEKRELKWR